MKKIKQLVGAGLVLVVSIVLVACTSSPSQDTDVDLIRLAYRPLALADVTPVILQEATLQVEGLEVELVPVPSPQVALQRFDAGEVDAVAGLTMEAVLQRIATLGDPGFRAYAFQADVAGNGWVSLVANRRLGEVTVGELGGRTVASLPTDQARFLVRRILQEAGVPDDDINIIDYNPVTPLLGLESGEHDAIFGLEPAISRAAAAGHTVIARGPISQYMFNGREIPLSASIVRTQFIQDNPRAFSAFQELVRQAIEFQNTRTSEAREFFADTDYGAIDPEVRATLAFPTMVDPAGPGVLPNLQEFVEELRGAGVLTTDIDVGVLLP